MSKFTIGVALVALVSVLAVPAEAASKGGGGGGGGAKGGGGGGGGGGGHVSSGGSAHVSSGGSARFSGSSGSSYSGGHIKSYSGGQFKSNKSYSGGQIKSYSKSYSGGPSQFTKQNKPNNFAGNQGKLNSKQTKATQNLVGQNVVGNGSKLNNKSDAVHKTLNSASVAGALKNKTALNNPKVRNNIVASAATAGKWQGNKSWWRHRHGGFGWVGPLFWPFAFYDFYDYLWWDDDYYTFWDYGYDDIYAGMFSPYDYDDLVGYLPYRTARSTRGVTQGSAVATAPPSESNQLAQMCGDDTSDIAGLPIDRFRQAIQPNEAQQAALDELARASAQAARDIKAACPTEPGLTAPTRLAVMEQRIEAMIGAVNTVQPPLENLYGLLSDEQKARLTALRNEQRQAKPTGSLAQSCGSAQSNAKGWPAGEIERAVGVTEAQRASLAELQGASAKAVEMLKSCPPDNPVTPPARLKAIGDRLETMLQAVKTVHAALDTFYAGLTDEQKARFEALGPQRTAQAEASADQDQPRVRHTRRHGGVNIYSILRRYGI